MGNYRMYVLRFESPPPDNCWEIVKDTPVTDDVAECDDWAQVESYLSKVFDLPASSLSEDRHCH